MVIYEMESGLVRKPFAFCLSHSKKKKGVDVGRLKFASKTDYIDWSLESHFSA